MMDLFEHHVSGKAPSLLFSKQNTNKQMLNLLFNKKEQRRLPPAAKQPNACIATRKRLKVPKASPGGAEGNTLEQWRSTKIFASCMRHDAAGMFMGLLHLAMAYTLGRAGHFAEWACPPSIDPKQRIAMYLLGLSLILLAMKYFAIGPVAEWPWWWFAVPFGLTVAWWSWADWSGYTKRKTIEKENAKKNARIERDRARLGLTTPRKPKK